MKILITGGAGFIGSHLSDYLIKRGDEIWAIDDLSTGKKENISHLENHSNFHFVFDSIMNREKLEELVDKCEYIYHLAAAVGVKYIIENPLYSLQVNIKGTENILEFANKKKKKVLIASTSEVYGKSEKLPFEENGDIVFGATYKARWGYGCSKAVDEFLGLAYFREKKLPIVIARLFNTCGPRQRGEYGMVIPRFIKQALLNYPITIYGTGKQTRCFCDVQDAVSGLVKLMDEDIAIGEIVNIGNNEEISIEELANKIKKLTKSNSIIEYISYEKAYESGFEDLKKRIPDLSKIKKLINYQPKINIDNLLKRTIEYFEA
ncbi:MAG: GDP-mannose 4,6-dehydratase [bacterium]